MATPLAITSSVWRALLKWSQSQFRTSFYSLGSKLFICRLKNFGQHLQVIHPLHLSTENQKYPRPTRTARVGFLPTRTDLIAHEKTCARDRDRPFVITRNTAIAIGR